MANRVTVTIRSHLYPILAEEEESYIRQCADLVSRELNRAMEGTTLSLDDGAVLAALNLADQIFKERQVSDNLRIQLKEALDENARLRRQKKTNKSGGKQAAHAAPPAGQLPEEPKPDQARPPIPEEPKPDQGRPPIPEEPEPDQTRLPIPEEFSR